MFCSGQIRKLIRLLIFFFFNVNFVNVNLEANDDQKAKLIKLLSLWESKANFFDACVISKLRSPVSSMQEYKTNLMNTYSSVVAAITQTTQATFDK